MEHAPDIAGWQLQSRLDAGDDADIWRAADGEGRVHALKVLRDPDQDPQRREAFLREGRILQRLHHPSLPRCLGVVDGVVPYLVLELLEGRTLQRLLRTDPRPDPELVVHIASAALRALSYVHERGITHRAISPQHIFLSDDRRVLLVGFSRATDPSEPLPPELATQRGEPPYAAPELQLGGDADHRCDLYSVGVTLYQALRGTPPTGDSGDAEALAEACPEAPVRLLDAVSRLVARAPTARPTTAALALAVLTGAGVTDRSLKPAPLIGRSAALGAIQAVLDLGGTAIVVGEIGSGVGRLAGLTLSTARREGMGSIAIRCRARAAALDPVQQLARELSPLVGATEPTEEGLVPAMAYALERRPMLLLIEDVEHLQPESAAALAAVAEANPELSVVATGSHAPDALTGHVVALRALSRDEVNRLVSAMLGTLSPPAGLTNQLFRLSDGMPGVVVLALKELVGRGALWCEGLDDDGDPVWRLQPAASMVPDQSLEQLFGGVLNNQAATARAVLEVLSVADEALPVDAVLSVADLPTDPEVARELIAPLLDDGLVRIEQHDDGDLLAVRRPAVAAMVLRRVDDDRARFIHRALAKAIIHRYVDDWHRERAAWHEAHGADPEHAPSALLQLGEDLLRSGQHTRALLVLTRAADLCGSACTTGAAIAVRRAQALDHMGRRRLAGRVLSQAIVQAEQVGDHALVLQARIGMARINQRLGRLDEASKSIDLVLSQIGHDADNPHLPVALLTAGHGLALQSRLEEARERYEQCFELAQEKGRPDQVATARGGLGRVLGDLGRLLVAADHLEHYAEWLRGRHRPGELATTLMELARCRLRLGEVDLAREAIREAEEASRFADLPHHRAGAQICQARLLYQVGDRDEAARQMKLARVALDADAPATIRLDWRAFQAVLRQDDMDSRAALAAHQAAYEDARREGWLGQAAYHSGVVAAAQGRLDDLRDSLSLLLAGGNRRLYGELLLAAGRRLADRSLLLSAREEALESSDRWLALTALHALGDEEARAEAEELVDELADGMPVDLCGMFKEHPIVTWARG